MSVYSLSGIANQSSQVVHASTVGVAHSIRYNIPTLPQHDLPAVFSASGGTFYMPHLRQLCLLQGGLLPCPQWRDGEVLSL